MNPTSHSVTVHMENNKNKRRFWVPPPLQTLITVTKAQTFLHATLVHYSIYCMSFPTWAWFCVVLIFCCSNCSNQLSLEHTFPVFLAFANVLGREKKCQLKSFFFIILICLTFFCSIFGLLTSALLRSDFCLGQFYMLEESCNLLLRSIYTSL